MTLADWHNSAASGFSDIESLARFLGQLKQSENVPRWLERMARRLAARLKAERVSRCRDEKITASITTKEGNERSL